MAINNKHEIIARLSVEIVIQNAIKKQLKKHMLSKPKPRDYDIDFMYIKAYQEWENAKQALEYELHLSSTSLN